MTSPVKVTFSTIPLPLFAGITKTRNGRTLLLS